MAFTKIPAMNTPPPPLTLPTFATNTQNAQPFADFVANNLWVSFVFVVAYVAFCYFGTKLMKDRLAFDLKW